MTGDESTYEELSDAELAELVGESRCASRPARDKESLAEYLERIAKEDGSSSERGSTP